jgi:hypothetical protein
MTQKHKTAGNPNKTLKNKQKELSELYEITGQFMTVHKTANCDSVVMSVRSHAPPDWTSATNDSSLTGRIFIKFDISIFLKSYEKIQVSLTPNDL